MGNRGAREQGSRGRRERRWRRGELIFFPIPNSQFPIPHLQFFGKPFNIEKAGRSTTLVTANNVL